MIRRLRVKNYKSIRDHEIELGRINVFIGENGSGKSNILEAMGFLAAGMKDQCDIEGLSIRGVRAARPSMTVNSFRRSKAADDVGFELEASAAPKNALAGSVLPPIEGSDAWTFVTRIAFPAGSLPDKRGIDNAFEARKNPVKDVLQDYGIYNPNALALRGLVSPSKRSPLGINGENLDVAIAELDDATRADLLERARCISWLDRFELDPSDELKFKGHKLGRSTSRLYFRDRYMQAKNNLFSAENANEGILHILFHLTLFAHPHTPAVFGIDNIETALNPQLCRDLMVQLAELSKRHEKQALIATHNPAILDGLNLLDDEQRLFVVSRNDEGHTVTRRIKLKPEAPEGKFKLSELWMRGHLGGLPERF